jgi:hypothetical protein
MLNPSDGAPVRPPLRAPPCAEGAPPTHTSPSTWKEVPRKGKTDRLIHSSLNDGRLSSLVKIQPVHLVSFKPVRTAKNILREKWDWAMPEELLRRSFASLNLELDAARCFAESFSHMK